METQRIKSKLATVLRVIGVLCIIGGFGTGMDFYFHGAFRGDFGIIIPFTLAGVMSCVICFALAKCVQAATIYLNSVTPKDKATKPWLKGTIFDEEPTNTPQQD